MQEYGPVYKSFGGSRPFVFVASPELVRQVLLTNTYRPVFPSIWLGKERQFDKANILVGLLVSRLSRCSCSCRQSSPSKADSYIAVHCLKALDVQAVRGEKHRSLRGAWTPMFFSGNLVLMDDVHNTLGLCNPEAMLYPYSALKVASAPAASQSKITGRGELPKLHAHPNHMYVECAQGAWRPFQR